MSEIERYSGLTTADKSVMLIAMKFGAKWLARDWTGQLYGYSVKPRKDDEFKKWTSSGGYMCLVKDKYTRLADWSDAEPVNIDLAIAQIAEMESKPLTWNERINQMTLEEKAKYFVAKKWSGAGSVYIAIDNSIHDRRKQAENRNKKILNSPYTEGDGTDEG